MSVGRVRRLRTLRLVRIRAIQGNGGGILMQPRRREGRDLQGLECNGAIDLVEMRGKQGLEDVPETVIVERGTCQPRLQQRQHPPFFQPSPHLIEGMMSIENGEHQSSTPRPHESPCAGWGGMRRSITVATSRRRMTPKTRGKCA